MIRTPVKNKKLYTIIYSIIISFATITTSKIIESITKINFDLAIGWFGATIYFMVYNYINKLNPKDDNEEQDNIEALYKDEITKLYDKNKKLTEENSNLKIENEYTKTALSNLKSDTIVNDAIKN